MVLPLKKKNCVVTWHTQGGIKKNIVKTKNIGFIFNFNFQIKAFLRLKKRLARLKNQRFYTSAFKHLFKVVVLVVTHRL